MVLTGSSLGRVDRVAISPDGGYVAAAGGADRRLVVWATRQPDRPLHVFDAGFGERMWNFCFDPASGLLIVGVCFDNATGTAPAGTGMGVVARDPADAAEVWRIPPGQVECQPIVTGLDVSSDGGELLVCFCDSYWGWSRCERWALSGRAQPIRGSGTRKTEEATRGVALLPATGGYVIAEDECVGAEPVGPLPHYHYLHRGRLRVVGRTGRTTHTLQTDFEGIHQLAVSRTGRWIAAQAAPEVLVWDTQSLAGPPRRLSRAQISLTGVAFSPSGRSLAVSGGTAVSVYETGMWQAAAAYEWGGEPLRSVCFNSDGGSIAAGSDGGRVVIWDAPSAAPAGGAGGAGGTAFRE